MQMVEGDNVEMTSTENLFHTVMLTLEMSDGVCLDVAEEREELCRRLVAALKVGAQEDEEGRITFLDFQTKGLPW